MKKVKFFILILGFSILGAGIINAQQVVATAGNHLENTQGSISWTLGEVAIQTLESADIILTQGFHQTRLVVTGVKITPGYEPDISAYPNPVTNNINVKMGHGLQAGSWSYAIFDITGKKLLEKKIESDLSQISLGSFPTATYFLKVHGGDAESKVFKIVKQ